MEVWRKGSEERKERKIDGWMDGYLNRKQKGGGSLCDVFVEWESFGRSTNENGKKLLGN